MNDYRDALRSILDQEARAARRRYDAVMAEFDKLDAAFDRISAPINPAPVTTTEASPASPGADLCSTPPDAEADGGDFSEVTK